jgi:hypothetical protein
MPRQGIVDRPPACFGVHVSVKFQAGPYRLCQKPRANTHDSGQGIPRTKDRRPTDRTKNPHLPGRGFITLQQVLPGRKRQPGCVHRNVGRKRAALCLPALRAVTNLNGRQLAFDGELNAFAKARSMVLGGHHIVLAQRTTRRTRRSAPPSLQSGPDFFPCPP